VKTGTRAARVPVSVSGKGELLAFLAKDLGLPARFGHNWDALVDVLRDVSWSEPGATIAVVHDGLPTNLSREDLATYLEILSDAASEPHRSKPAGPRPLVTFPEAARAEVERLLRR
jgi:RNAse (barnase) inhibitor barstar